MSLWDAPASDTPAFTFPEVDMEELKRICKERQEDPEFQEKLRKRLAPYRTPVTWETLKTWLT